MARILSGTAILTLLASSQAVFAQSELGSDNTVRDIIVTAQKREQRLMDVGMSVQALTGDSLLDSGVTAPADLVKTVPGFNFNLSNYGTPIYTMRGIGFQETTISAGPTVTVYVDEVPIPFPLMTLGTMLDLGRLEVLKGPQGTLFGQNSTGGALNFVAARPTENFEAGVDVSYSTFDTVNVRGYVSGALAPTLKVRAAADYTRADGWQWSYTRPGERNGAKDFLNGRILIDWDPTSDFSLKLNVSGWRDHGEIAAPQFVGYDPLNENAPLLPEFRSYPHAPEKAGAADWDPDKNLKGDVRMLFTSLRMDYNTGIGVTLTSLSSYQTYDRYQIVEGDGTTLESYSTQQEGDIKSFYQELRASGDFGGKGSWVFGGNYSRDKVWDRFLQMFNDQSSREVFGLPFGRNYDYSIQKVTTLAGFANAEYPIIDDLSLQAGIRYTDVKRTYEGCGADAGDGHGAAIFDAISALLRSLNGITDPLPPIAAGACYSIGEAPTFLPGVDYRELKEDNLSWRVGLNYKPLPDTLLYANISKGYKAGSFPTISNALKSQQGPATQESVLAYEIGAKTRTLGGALELTGAAFYYDYKDKQIIGFTRDIVFGPLSQLVNIPKSRVQGFEFSAVAYPWTGATFNGGVSYTDSKITEFIGLDFKATVKDFAGSAFPFVPKWQAQASFEQIAPLSERWNFFVGGDLNYKGDFYTSFGKENVQYVPAYTLFNLHAGIQDERWRVMVWAHNLTDKYYWTSAGRVADSQLRRAGMPRTVGITASYRYK